MKCLMPLSAGQSSESLSCEVSQLQLRSEKQLEDDVARIFDESIYSDLEVVCGKLKILTHSCILKARTHKFYHKLEAILHVNIGRNTFEELYSFISDIYTECDINHQEKEIIKYLNKNLSIATNNKSNHSSKLEVTDEIEVYSTPNCVSPEDKSYEKTQNSSPSTELKREYYALVPIESNVLDRELVEQDALSSAFHSINKSEFEDNTKQNVLFLKPTSLSLNSSHMPKVKKHSSICDNLQKPHLNSDSMNKIVGFGEKQINHGTCQSKKAVQRTETDNNNITGAYNKTSNVSEKSTDKVLDPIYTPDSLIADEISSSSDYLSATYAVSPGTVLTFSSGFSQFNVEEQALKMDNIVTISDSGLETAGMLESLNSHKDVTLTDVSLTESTLRDMMNEDINCQVSASNVPSYKITHETHTGSPSEGTHVEKNVIKKKSHKLSFEMASPSTKDEKQRLNDIVMQESSSLSSETGSWESVFPPKITDTAENIISKNSSEEEINTTPPSNMNTHNDIYENTCPSLVPKSPYKLQCFIDASSLADEGDVVFCTENKNVDEITETNVCIAKSTQPEPGAINQDLSPNDSSSIENNDSLERDIDNKDDLTHKDISPTIFKMSPSTEKSSEWSGIAMQNKKDAEPVSITEENKSISNERIFMPTLHTSSQDNTTDSGFFVVNNSFSSYNSVIENGNKSIDSNKTQFIIDRNCVSLDTSLAVENKPHMTENSSSGGNVTAAVLLNKQNYSVYNEIVLAENGYIQIHSKTQIQNNIGNRNKTTRDCPKNEKPIENEIMQGSYEIENGIQLPNSAGPSSPHNSLASLNNLKKIDSNAVGDTLSNSFTKKDLLNLTSKSPSSFWVVDMSSISNDSSVDGSAKSLVLPVNNDSLNKVENHTSSGSKENLTVSTQKFYIDLSKLPDVKEVDVKKLQTEEGSEKNNIFSMFIDLSDKTTTKEMPARLSSSLNSKKNTRTDNKTSKSTKTSVTSETKVTSTETSTNRTIEESILFEKLETLCDDPNISITEIKARPLNLESLQELGVSKIKRKDHDLSNKVIQEEPATGESLDLFVKLSDLDKPAPKTEHGSFTYKRDSHERMTRSIPDKDWRESSQTIALKSSSFHSENALSLNRLFPHLKNEFSRSMPGSLSSRTKSPLRHGSYSSPADNYEHQTSDVSEMSSVHSSLRSVVENSSTTEEIEQTSSLISNCQSRLGQDLLRMFLEEIAPDVIVEVKGRRIRAHKCILSSRCQYFAGILSGGWVESAGNVISLPPFAFSVVHFALCHIYSGISVIPDSINILELATLADMLGLEGLKEGIMIMLKTKYCHNFHKPCSLCTAGVMECFPLASLYGLDDLYRKCLRWITKYFQRVWPTKAFATLPAELIDKCCQEHIINLTTENFVDVVYGSGITVSSLSESRWAIVVSSACRRLLNAAAQFAAARLCDVVAALAAVPAADAAPPAARALHDCVAAAIEWAPPDQACRAYRLLVAVREQSAQRERSQGRGEAIEPARRSLLSAHAGAWRALCEGALVRSAPRVVPTAAFAALPPELRDRLRQLGCISYGAPAAFASPRPARRARSSNNYAMRSLDIDQVRACFVPYATKPQPQFGSVDSLAAREPRLGRVPPCANGKTFPPAVRTTKAQEQRIKYNALKNTQRIIPPVQQGRPTQSARATTSRYLQPQQPKEKPPGKPQARMVSSSDSSRRASPTQRGARARGARDPAPPPPRLRTADPALDPRPEPDAAKYATYTKARHNNQGSVEAVHTLTKNNKSVKARTETQPESPKTVKRQQQKTKIPVFTKTVAKHNKASQVASTNRLHSASSNGAASQPNARKPSGSLMNSTKSSQAKIVNKPKETGKLSKSSLEPSMSKAKGTSPRSSAPDIPVMERSGTFLKDEPSFKDITTDIDIDN